jgi:hypothetical protein
MRLIALSGMVFVTSCLTLPPSERVFMLEMRALCGGTYEGRVISDQAVDADWIGEALILGPVSCRRGVMRLPLAVGEDGSRTWVLTETPEGLLFKHEHVEPDGSPSPVTQYGGLAVQDRAIFSRSFPADEETKAIFTENGIARSNTNVWTLTFDRERETLTYSLARPATETDPARDFRAEFDLTD